MTATKQRALVIALIGLGILIVGIFGWRTIHAFGEFRGHRPPRRPFESGQPATDVTLIRDWMTIGFLSHMYRTPPNQLYEALGIPPNGNERKSLKQLNDEYFPDQPGHVLEIVKATIQATLPPTVVPTNTANPPPTKISP